MADAEFVSFRIGDAFTPGDEVSTWVATVAAAANDFAATGVASFPEEPTGHENYSMRAAVAHLNEIGKFLDETSDVETIKEFVASLSGGQDEYANVIAIYLEHKSRLEAMRSHGAFHYPPWNPARGAIMHGIANAADSSGFVKIGSTVGISRYLFADEIILRAMAHACGGDEKMYETTTAASDAMGDFMTFGEIAVFEHVRDRATLTDCELVDPTDWSKGFRYR